ncbi:MAG: PhoX family phosphatase [Campylobacterales bacterium]|nr:PhoX family phosphatase [Campylobacterales bacterium]
MEDKNLQGKLLIGHDDCNNSNNESFDDVLSQRLNRRDLMKLSAGLIGSTLFGSFMSGCNSDETTPATSPVAAAALLSFTPVAKNMNDTVTVATGYTANVLYRVGDPIKLGVNNYLNDGTDTDFDSRSGDCHDGMKYFGLKADNSGYELTNSTNGLMCINHEYINQNYLHTVAEVAAINNASRIPAQVDKEMAAHGVAVIKITNGGTGFALDKTSGYNRRITATTPMKLQGVAAGSSYMVTPYSTTGMATRGTVNNCANGYTPWGTYLTCEENWNGYFKYSATGRTAKEVAAFSRYGLSATSRYGWESVYTQWMATVTGADATADYRYGPNTFGYNVEIDPFNPTSTPVKHTAMGRFAHEGCWPAKATAGKPVVFYMGDDSKGEYIYKFVSTQNWDAADATGGLTAGAKYLDSGTLYVAKFNADGTGNWLKLDISETAIATYATYTFADAADVAVHSRLAADAMGATKMDRPEWGGVHPTTGEVYMTLTNNSNRAKTGSYGLDAANPRYYTDTYNVTTTNKGNVNGHIIRWKETGSEPAATTFAWDIYLFGAQSDANATNVNLSGLTADNDFSSPDGLWFSDVSKGLMWIQTDDGAYTDTTNCMLLAALPGSVNDGTATSVTSLAVPTNGTADQAITTYVGAKPGTTKLKRFLVGPKDCEITGITETPDGKTIFVNVQHPGEDGTTTALTSHWPDGETTRPRSSTIVITKNDGGIVGI